MRRGKRTLTQALGALVLLSSLIGFTVSPTLAAGIDSLTLDPETATVAPGASTTLTITISGEGHETNTEIVTVSTGDIPTDLEVGTFDCTVGCTLQADDSVTFEVNAGEPYSKVLTLGVTVSENASDGQQLVLEILANAPATATTGNADATFTVSTDTGTAPATTTATATATGTAPATTTATATATGTAPATTTATATGTPPDATDTDEDGTPDVSDNCPAIANTDQADANANGIGDACESAVTLDISSNFRSFAGTLPAGTTWVLVQDNTVLASATLTDADVALPASLPLGDGVQFGDYTLTIFAGSDFSNYAADVTFDEAAETVDVELSSSLVDDLVDVLIQILEDILNG